MGPTIHTRCWPTRRKSPATHLGDRWFVDETYVKVNGVWRYVYRAIDQDSQVIDVLVSDRTAQVIIAGHAFMQNLRRGHYELATDLPVADRVPAAFTELSKTI